MADSFQSGFLRTAPSAGLGLGALVVVRVADAVLPLTDKGGFLRDATGALVVDDPA